VIVTAAPDPLALVSARRTRNAPVAFSSGAA